MTVEKKGATFVQASDLKDKKPEEQAKTILDRACEEAGKGEWVSPAQLAALSKAAGPKGLVDID